MSDTELPAVIADASSLPRLGVKGPNAEGWLAAQGLQLPAANRWHFDRDLKIARLGRSEFLLEPAAHPSRIAQLAAELAPGPGRYPVLRQDAAFWLAGSAAPSVLRQLASYDFTTLAGDDTALLTLLAGVSATILWQPTAAGRCYSIYCDASYRADMWLTLLSLVHAEGGAAVSFAALAPPALQLAAPIEPNPTPMS